VKKNMKAIESNDQPNKKLEVIATEKELRKAVGLWFSNRYHAEVKYGHISKWDVSLIFNMRNLFKDKTDFNEDISDWDVRNVKDMSHMFAGAVKFNQPLYKWKISGGTKRKNMFAGATTYNECRGLMPVLTLDSCLHRNDVPVELRVISRSFLAKAICPDTMEKAVDLWNSNREQSNLMYGEICHWHEMATFSQPEATLLELTNCANALARIAQESQKADAIREAHWLELLISFLVFSRLDHLISSFNALAASALNAASAAVILHRGGLFKIARFLNCSEASLRGLTSMILGNLAIIESNRELMLKAKVSPLLLLSLLEDTDPGVRFYVAKAIGNFAPSKKVQKALSESGKLQTLMKLFSDPEEAVSEEAVKAFYKLCEQHVEFHDYLRQINCIETLFERLQSEQRDAVKYCILHGFSRKTNSIMICFDT
jgi:hypothetical protein